MTLPQGVSCILFHPQRRVETQAARELLSPEVSKQVALEHSRNMAAFVAGCATNDLDLVASGLKDIFIEPQRLPLLPELAAVQAAALAEGALGCSVSGSGPSVFAWAPSKDLPAVEKAMAAAFKAAACPANAYDAPLESAGLRAELIQEHA